MPGSGSSYRSWRPTSTRRSSTVLATAATARRACTRFRRNWLRKHSRKPDRGSASVRSIVIFLKQNLRSQAPPGPFDLILCRNLAFTYFAPVLRQKTLAMFAERLVPKGFLVVGAHEQVRDARFVSAPGIPRTFMKTG